MKPQSTRRPIEGLGIVHRCDCGAGSDDPRPDGRGRCVRRARIRRAKSLTSTGGLTRTALSIPLRCRKVLDTITPVGVLQSAELDYTVHKPVVLSGVAVP
jgi:hypothetical protein